MRSTCFAFCEDPLQGLLSAGIGWLIEHVSFLSEPLDYLAGDPDLVQEKAQTWDNIKTALEQAAKDYQQSASAPAAAVHRFGSHRVRDLGDQLRQGRRPRPPAMPQNAKTAMVARGRDRRHDTWPRPRLDLGRSWRQAIEKAAVALATSLLDFGASMAVFIGDEVVEGEHRWPTSPRSELTELPAELEALASKAQRSGSTAEHAASSVATDANKLTKRANNVLHDASKVGRRGSATARAAAKTDTAAALHESRTASRGVKKVLDEVDANHKALLDAATPGGGLNRGLVDAAAQARHTRAPLEKALDDLLEQRRVAVGRRLGVPEKTLQSDKSLREILAEHGHETPGELAKRAPVEAGRQGYTERQNRDRDLAEQQEERGELPDGSLLDG